MNINQIITFLKGQSNPQQAFLGILNQQAQNGNPMIANILNLARNNNTSDLEQLARNIAKEKGIDFDKAFEEFKRNFNL